MFLSGRGTIYVSRNIEDKSQKNGALMMSQVDRVNDKEKSSTVGTIQAVAETGCTFRLALLW